MSFTLRALTPDGLQAAIAKAYRLNSVSEVHSSLAMCYVPFNPCAFEKPKHGLLHTKPSSHSTTATQVKQVSHWITYGPGFFEPIRSSTAFRMLPDPAWVVWSRQPRRGAAAIPLRGDAHLQSAAGSVLLQGLTENEV